MKALVAYYSRTGKTRTAAMQVSEILGCGSEEIRDTARRSGLLGYLRSGLEGAMRRKARIKKVSLDPRSYDLLIVATPLWAGKISSPVRSYLSLFPRGLPPVALLCTASGGSADDASNDLKRTIGAAPIASLCLSEDQADDPRTVVNLRIFLDGVIEKMK
jgi:flavodoxin